MIEVGRPVVVRVREFAQPFKVVGDEMEMLSRRYELVERRGASINFDDLPAEEKREEAAYCNGLKPWELK